jgi:predicted transposase YbfD/YdcC
VLRSAINPDDLESVMQAYFTTKIAPLKADQVCLDGKQIRGTQDKEGEGNVYLLGAYVPGAGVMLLQMEVGVGEGELSVAPKLIRRLELQGKVATGDAAFAQRNLSVEIVASSGEYVWKVKANQPQLLEDIELLFGPPLPVLPATSTPKTDFRTVTETRFGHGRVETRTLTASSLLKPSSDWPNLEQVFKIETETLTKKTNKRTRTVSYGVTSLRAEKANPHRLLEIVLNHWAIEGGSHQRRDTTFHEDGCGLRRGHAAHIMATLNNLAISLIAQNGFTNAALARRVFAADPAKAFRLLVCAT